MAFHPDKYKQQPLLLAGWFSLIHRNPQSLFLWCPITTFISEATKWGLLDSRSNCWSKLPKCICHLCAAMKLPTEDYQTLNCKGKTRCWKHLIFQLFDAVSRIYNSVIFENFTDFFSKKFQIYKREQPLQPGLTSNSFHVSAQRSFKIKYVQKRKKKNTIPDSAK